jgi:hypothetical protein
MQIRTDREQIELYIGVDLESFLDRFQWCLISVDNFLNPSILLPLSNSCALSSY